MQTRLTTLKFKNYLRRAKNAEGTENDIKIRDVLYTFLNYYQNLKDTPMLTQSGQEIISVLSAFRQVFKQYHLDKPLSKMNYKQLEPAIKPSVRTMELWYYTMKDQLRYVTVDIKQIKDKKVALAKIYGTINRIKNFNDLCLGLSVKKTRVQLTIVPNKYVIR